MPACGKCGYPARGIDSLHCPECGADLREVGIGKPGQGRGQGTLAVVLFVYSITFMILCGIFSEVVDDYLPWYGSANARLSLTPTHNEYDARVRIETSETLWGHSFSNSLGFNQNSYSNSGNTPIQISLAGLTPNMEIDVLTIGLHLNNVPPGATFRPQMEIDPETAVATWQGLDGKTQQSSGPLTEQDVLRFLASAGMDEKQSQAITDAQQLHLFLDGLIQRKTQFTMVGFSSYSAGGGSSSGGGPEWIWPLYTLVCVLIWVLGLTLIARRYNRQVTTQTKS